MTTILVSSIFLYTKKDTDDQTKHPSSTILEKNKLTDSDIITPLPTQIITNATTSPNESVNTSSTTIKSTTTFIATTKQTPHSQKSNNPQILEIDTTEIDTRSGIQRPNPCATPIFYTLGNFDSRFNISKNDFLNIVNDSVSMWNNVVNKKLFEYDATGNINSLSINLIYDERQKKTDESKLIGAEIENTKNAALSMQTEYEALKVIFSQHKNEYEQRVNDFNTRQKIYNDRVEYWNEKGGAPQTEYDTLITEKEKLRKESALITVNRDTLNAMLEDINTKITKHNEFVTYANKKVDINNSTADKKFTEGNYSPSVNKISIYQFTDNIKLKRVLAHEFGHALGIDHLKNKQSIMYAINSATTTYLDSEDIQAIRDICSHN